ncbi:hypothetical protein [Streptomyces phage JXY1]|uniref:Uncharacterized protein n=1 Tax=Streptomyces phage JXY1 TaxID=2708562 RepID=A0A6C0RS88_9CAUD|nr:hypothetical protein HWD10_gp52 [Streptomyces phage JXY1]QIA28825.1 hypothetical protein [Streptomyces phage JXY1]
MAHITCWFETSTDEIVDHTPRSMMNFSPVSSEQLPTMA